jgi:hypothetical protein
MGRQIVTTITEIAPEIVDRLSRPGKEQREYIRETLTAEALSRDVSKAFGSVEEVLLSTQDPLHEQPKLVRGAALFLLFHRLCTQTEYTIERKTINALLKDDDLQFFIREFYNIPPKHELRGLQFLTTGTTSIILKCPIYNVSVLKLLQAPYVDLPSIQQATVEYRDKYSAVAEVSAPVHDCGRTWILMKFISGLNLSEFLAHLREKTDYRSQPEHAVMPDEYVSKVATVFRGITRALSFCACHGIYHGDLNPLNVIVQCDDLEDPDDLRITGIRLIDFGLNHVLQDRLVNRRIMIEVFSRTELFMPPELREPHGALLDKSDLYSLGMIGLELLSRTPLESRLVGIRLREIWERPSTVGIAQIIEDLLDRNPATRFTLLKGRPNTGLFEALNGLLQAQLEHYRNLMVRAATDARLKLPSKFDVWRSVQTMWSAARSKARPYNPVTRREAIAAQINAFAQGIIVLSAVAYTIVDIRQYFDLQTILPLDWLQQLIQLSPRRFDIGAIWENLPGRAVALTFGLVAARYYANIFAPLVIEGDSSRLSVFLNWWMRFNSFSYFAPIMAAIVYAPHWWPFCTVAGAGVTVVNNYLCWKLSKRSAVLAHQEFSSVEQYHDVETKQFLDAIHEWAVLMGWYVAGIGLVGLLLTLGIAKDEFIYGTIVSLINMVQLYRNNCGALAPDVSGHLSRLFFYLRRRSLIYQSAI